MKFSRSGIGISAGAVSKAENMRMGIVAVWAFMWEAYFGGLQTLELTRGLPH